MSNILIKAPIENKTAVRLLDIIPCDVWHTANDISQLVDDLTPHQVGHYLGYMKRLGLVESDHKTRQSGYPLRWRVRIVWRRKK